MFAASLASLAAVDSMAPLRAKLLQLWVLAAVTARVTEAEWKPEMIGDELISEVQGNTLTLRSSKVFMTDGPEPGDTANAFIVRTLEGEFCYEPGSQQGPVIIHAFTNKSGFLECLWSSESSLSSLVQELPDSAQVLFLSLDDSAVSDALWMREQVHRVAAAHRCPVGSRCVRAEGSGSQAWHQHGVRMTGGGEEAQ